MLGLALRTYHPHRAASAQHAPHGGGGEWPRPIAGTIIRAHREVAAAHAGTTAVGGVIDRMAAARSRAMPDAISQLPCWREPKHPASRPARVAAFIHVPRSAAHPSCAHACAAGHAGDLARAGEACRAAAARRATARARVNAKRIRRGVPIGLGFWPQTCTSFAGRAMNIDRRHFFALIAAVAAPPPRRPGRPPRRPPRSASTSASSACAAQS